MVFQAWKRKCVPILLIALSFLFHLNVYPVSGHAADRPNIVFILADDLGYGDIKAFGGSRCNIDTPHFDKVCADGLRFTDAHVTDSVCIPSRTSMMTGALMHFDLEKRSRAVLGDSPAYGFPKHSIRLEICFVLRVTPRAMLGNGISGLG